MPSVKLRILWFLSFKLTSGVFALLGTDDTDRTRVDCSDPPGAPGDLLYFHSIGNPRLKITDTGEKGGGVVVARIHPAAMRAVYFEFHK